MTDQRKGAFIILALAVLASIFAVVVVGSLYFSMVHGVLAGWLR